MKKKLSIFAVLFCSLLLTSPFALSASQAQEQERVEAQKQEHIYGSQMMTEQERNEYRARMQAAKTNEEREQIRMEHHELMKKRAAEQGLGIPDSPPARRGGMGGDMGPGMGGGKGKNR